VKSRGVLAVAGAALLWSTGGVGIKAVDLPALDVACYRSACAALVLFVLFRPRLRLDTAFLAAIGSYAACLTTFVVATKWTTAANAIVLQYSGVVWVLVLAPLLLDEPFHARDAIGIAAALAGVVLLFAGELGSPGRAGDLVALVSGVFFALVIVTLRRERGGGGEAVVTYGNALAAAVLLPLVGIDWSLSARDAALIVFLGTVQIAGAYVLFVRGVRDVPAAQAALVGLLEPVTNPVWVFLMLGEQPSAYAVAGGVIVLAAIAWRTVD
jgi:drug/metabolite transporter (DMT)-like permease